MSNVDYPNLPKQFVPEQSFGAGRDVEHEGGVEMLSAPKLKEVAGANHLYIAVDPEKMSDKPQIIVLGAHGGDAAAQGDFIATLRVN